MVEFICSGGLNFDHRITHVCHKYKLDVDDYSRYV